MEVLIIMAVILVGVFATALHSSGNGGQPSVVVINGGSAGGGIAGAGVLLVVLIILSLVLLGLPGDAATTQPARPVLPRQPVDSPALPATSDAPSPLSPAPVDLFAIQPA